jgi:hypothetical protein
MRRFILCNLIGMAVVALIGCSTDSEPDPPARNSPMSIVTDLPSYHWDEPVEQSIRISDDDGIASGFVRAYALMDSSSDTLEVFSQELRNEGTSFVKAWTAPSFPEETSLDTSGELFVEYSVTDGFSEPETKTATRSTPIRPSRFTEFDLRIEDFFSGQGLDGHVTFPGWRTAPIIDGVASIGRDMEISRDSLENTLYRVVVESSSHPDHSSQLRTDDSGVMPVRVSDDYDKVFLHDLDRHGFAEGSFVTYRVEDGTEIINRMYDCSHVVKNAELNRFDFVRTDDETLLAPEGFFSEQEQYLNEALAMIPSSTNISATYVRDCDSDLPRTIDFEDGNVYFMSGGSDDANFALERASRVNNQGHVSGAYLLKNTGFEQDPFSLPSAIAREMAEHLGVPTSSGQGSRIATINLDSIWTPEAKEVFELHYSRPSYSGIVNLEGAGFENKSGTKTTYFGDWVSDW